MSPMPVRSTAPPLPSSGSSARSTSGSTMRWRRSSRRSPRSRPQPVSPIFQPEVAAEAIVFAAHARRREIDVAGPTVEAIIANKVAPGLLDWYLARTCYDGQLTEEPEPQRPDNLFAPVRGN